MEGQKNEGHNLPKVMVVKPHPSNGSRGRVATELADHFNYFLADHYDIYPFLKKSPAFPEGHNFDDLSFEILYKMASTQVLDLKIGVVLNAPFINQTHLERLLKLSGPDNMILIHCRSPQGEENQQQVDDLDVEGVRKLTVDPMNLFFLEELVSAILPAEQVRHLHEFLFFRETKNEQKLKCKRCRNPISSGPSYQCVECDEYSFHKNCAESTNDLGFLQKNCLPYLSGRNQPDYNKFAGKERCKECDVSNLENCHDCLFETNINSNYLPIILHHKMHAHPLNLLIMPLSYGYEYGCCGCGEIGKCISYRCFDCNFNLHVSCCYLQESAKHRAHRHNLLISSQFQGDYGREEYTCDICKEVRDPQHWAYVCEDCKFVAHIACALGQPRSSWMDG